MNQLHCNLMIFDFLGFTVRPDEAYVYASTGISDPHHILGPAAWGCPPQGAWALVIHRSLKGPMDEGAMDQGGHLRRVEEI